MTERAIDRVSDPAVSANRKFRWRILAPIVVLIVLSSLDRVNISFAALQMNDAIGLSAERYGFAVGLFFVGYLLFQFPSTALLTRIGARRWIAVCVIAWGTVAMSMAFVHTPNQLFVLRFLLGCAESGFAPGIVYYTSQWMPERYRANTIAITMLAVPISVIAGGPLCGWLMSTTNPMSVPGWRWMIFVEGIATIAMGVIAYGIIVDKPADARWLSDAERDWIERKQSHKRDDHPRESALAKILGAMQQGRIWLAAGVWAATLIGANGMIFWLPQVLKELTTQKELHINELGIGVMSALPWLGVALGMIVNSWHSDRTQERFWHVGIALLVTALALCGVTLNVSGIASLALLFIAGVGLGSAQGVFWSIPTTFLPRSSAVQGITLINLVGNVGSLVGPYVIGLIRSQQYPTFAPIWFVAAVLSLGLLLLFSLRSGRDALA